MTDDDQCFSVHSGSKHQLTIAEKVTIIESMVRSKDRKEKKLYSIRPY